MPGAIFTSAVVSSPLAWAMQPAAAARTASLVRVAPDTPSTSALWASRICWGICSTALEPMPLLSLSPTMATSVMLSASKVMVTVTSPP